MADYTRLLVNGLLLFTGFEYLSGLLSISMIKYLQLKRSFDAALMQAEAAALEQAFWKQHYNTHNYEGNWSIIPLRSVNGSTDNIFSIHNRANDQLQYADTALLDGCPYIKEVIDSLQCDKTAVRLMKLDPGAVIKEHTDEEMSYEEGEVRFHIPVQTNEGLAFYVEDERVIMEEGSCWYLNLSLKHRVTNAGTTPRIHLVIDALVNDWVHNQFAAETLVKKEIENQKQERYRPEDKEQIIAQLRLLNTPVALEMAAKLENETSQPA